MNRWTMIRGCAVLAVLIGTQGCENTVWFAERTGFNLGVHVNDDPATPLRVNAGLNRSVATLVPAEHYATEGDESTADGEAVSLFSGFRLKYDEGTDPGALNRRLTIRTQFASGQAAKEIAGQPRAVAKVVNVTSFDRDAEFVEETRQARVDMLRQRIAALSGERAIALVRSPPVVDPAMDQEVALNDPDVLRFEDPDAAREALVTRLTFGDRSDAALDLWEQALQ